MRVCVCVCARAVPCLRVHVDVCMCRENQFYLPGFTERLLIECVCGHAWFRCREDFRWNKDVELWYMTLIKIKYTTNTLYMHTYIHKKHSVSHRLLVGCLPKLDVCLHWKCDTQIFLQVPSVKGRLKHASQSLMWSFSHKINKTVHLSRLH